MGTISQHDLYRLIGDANARGERVVVATVAHTRGSTPQRRGAKMLFFASGDVAGPGRGRWDRGGGLGGKRGGPRPGGPAAAKVQLPPPRARAKGVGCGGGRGGF